MYLILGFEFPAIMKMENIVFWDISLYSPA
jgi:hypothetical protein